ncbi:MAG: corrinoid protein [Bacilli bacterium]|nr:corrinoid protein [Bacilli bacterium]
MNILEKITSAIVDGDNVKVIDYVEQAIKENVSAQDILNKGLILGMNQIGKLWNDGDIFIPEVLVAARAMNSGSEIIESSLLKSGVEPIATAIIGTVKGDLHDIGKNIVGMMLKGKGFHVIDLGVDVTKEQYLDAVKSNNASFVVCSSLITTTMNYMKDVIEYFKEQGFRERVIIACGGAPVTQEFADAIGADVYTADAVKLSEVFLDIVEVR